MGTVDGSPGCGWPGSGIVKGSGDGSFDMLWQYPVDDAMERVSVAYTSNATSDATSSWSQLEPPLRLALQLAWQSLRSGSFGIGAVITAADGTVLSSGRNRLGEHEVGDDLLAGTSLAHAEMNALAKLRFGSHAGEQVTLWTTLQPCLQCLGAIRLSPVTDVIVLSPDPLFRGVERVRHLIPFLERAWPVMTEREVDEWAVLGLLFPTHLGSFWQAQVDLWQLALPQLVALADALVATQELIDLAVSTSAVEEVAGQLWERLSVCVDEVRRLGADTGQAWP
jgi:tRNA(Arg) A34 adenosine deaminase TadA